MIENLFKDSWNLVFGITGIIGFGASLYLIGKDMHKGYKTMMEKREKETIVVYDARNANISGHPKNLLGFFGLTK